MRRRDIAEIASLESLTLPATVTERGLAALKPLKRLKRLSPTGGLGDGAWHNYETRRAWSPSGR